jgi:single-strand DNA-binding protein
MRDWNKVTLVGALGKDPELKSTPNGNKFVRMTLATTVRWTDQKTKESKSQTEWHHLSAWDKVAEIMADQLKKGDRVMMSGKIHYNEYTDAKGEKKTETQIQVEDFAKLEKSFRVGGETHTGPAKTPFVEEDSIPF